jgi:single-strand DNA-binding protein
VAATNINRVVMTGNLTADPELRSLPSGASVCSLRIACNTRRKNQSTGEWEDKPNYFNVTVWGAQGENAARYLSKGRPVAIDGRLEWREWEAQDGTKRQATDIIADSVQFLGSREEASAADATIGDRPARDGASGSEDIAIDEQDFQPAPAGRAGDDDIPF